ncbi:hypothetical protein [Methylopila sp. 73B]|uniref:hypothetical protein n=1 Tax=Methylopila sp. 73B TaxID=1120792 RepID=UPI000369C16D|nr:hypothetical protein [Methylopila sp. 73B]
MKRVRIDVSHTGYPGGTKRSFVEGEELDLRDDYAELITSPEKRLAHEIPDEKASPPVAKTPAEASNKQDGGKS